jgi:murein L,D-transpeptidase YcbB/YkuD
MYQRQHNILRRLALMIGALVALSLILPSGAWALDPNALENQIRRHLSRRNIRQPVSLAAPAPLERFYAQREYSAVWLDAAGLKPAAQALLEALRDAPKEGLDPGDYALAELKDALAELLYQAGSPAGMSPSQAAALDVGLSRTALSFGRHLAEGRISPQETGQSWFSPVNSEAWQPRLARMLAAGNASAVTAAAAPPQPGYAGLRRALEQYLELKAQGGWAPIAGDQTLETGMQDEKVIHLRKRLEQSGDLLPEINRIAANSMSLDRFDPAVANAVTTFQIRHGLTPDGKVGKQTLAALNVPVERRIDTLRANMERRRWTPRDMAPRHLRVNIPAFKLEVVADGRVLKTMRVVVGRPQRPTPVLSGRMTYLELNPYWHIPPRIARKDILPKVQADPDYLFEHGIRVFSDWTDQARELDPQEIDWARVSAARFPYKLRQDPAAFNALGQVKFIFPNPHSIYLHDTPAKGLFDKQRRSFSSGCVRVAEPQTLAALLLRDRPAWNRERITEVFASLAPTVVRLKTPMPVHLQYWTAWADEVGRVHFRDDIYGRDRALLKALERRQHPVATRLPGTDLKTIEAAATSAQKTLKFSSAAQPNLLPDRCAASLRRGC